MGLEVAKDDFSEADYELFADQLKEETLQLLEWLKEDKFSQQGYSTGLELEGWLVAPDGTPVSGNQAFLRQANHPQIQCELSQFNIEINSSPREIVGNSFSQLRTEISKLINQCRVCAESLGQQFVTIGTLPTLKREMMSLQSMTPLKRYQVLNRGLFPVGQGDGHLLHMRGRDELKLNLHDVMLASAATSLQCHLKAPVDQVMNLFNAAQVLSGPIVAVCANSPFLLGKDLWYESRIPLFEHVLNGDRSRCKDKSQASRVSFGTGFIQESLAEYFLDNLHNFPVLLPDSCSREIQKMAHLSLHNGTIWRWNRLVVGFEDDGQPHLRIEHRPPSSSPSTVDAIADLAFFIGASLALSKLGGHFEKDFSFNLMHRNFYRAAKFGLKTEVYWLGGKRLPLKSLLLEELIPKAMASLLELEVDSTEVDYFLGEIVKQRVESGQTGAQWQRDFICRHGHEHLDKMLLKYLENQVSGQPVHCWGL